MNRRLIPVWWVFCLFLAACIPPTPSISLVETAVAGTDAVEQANRESQAKTLSAVAFTATPTRTAEPVATATPLPTEMPTPAATTPPTATPDPSIITMETFDVFPEFFLKAGQFMIRRGSVDRVSNDEIIFEEEDKDFANKYILRSERIEGTIFYYPNLNKPTIKNKAADWLAVYIERFGSVEGAQVAFSEYSLEPPYSENWSEYPDDTPMGDERAYFYDSQRQSNGLTAISYLVKFRYRNLLVYVVLSGYDGWFNHDIINHVSEELLWILNSLPVETSSK